MPEYTAYVLGLIKLRRPLTIVIDAGNGTGGVVAVPIFRALGCQVTELFCDMDGRFPNHHPDPTLPEAMDGPGQGRPRDGGRPGHRLRRRRRPDRRRRRRRPPPLGRPAPDHLRPRHPAGASRARPIISEVKATKVLYDEIARLGGRPIMWKTGHSLIKKKIKEENALLAGEMSGHIFFADRWFGFDDAIYASARLLEIAGQVRRRSSRRCWPDLPKTFSTPEIRIYASDEVKFKIVDEVTAELAARVSGHRHRRRAGHLPARAGPWSGPPTPRPSWSCASRPRPRRTWRPSRPRSRAWSPQAIHKLGQ